MEYIMVREEIDYYKIYKPFKMLKKRCLFKEEVRKEKFPIK